MDSPVLTPWVPFSRPSTGILCAYVLSGIGILRRLEPVGRRNATRAGQAVIPSAASPTCRSSGRDGSEVDSSRLRRGSPARKNVERVVVAAGDVVAGVDGTGSKRTYVMTPE